MVHDEFATFDSDIANDTSSVPRIHASTPTIDSPPRSRQIEEIHDDAEVVMGISPGLAPVESFDYQNDRNMGG